MLLQNLNQHNLECIKIEITAKDLESVILNTIEKAKIAFLEDSTQKENDGFIFRHEAREILKVKTDLTMIRLERKGFIKPYKMGARIMYKRSEILAAFENLNRQDANTNSRFPRINQ